MNHDYLWSKTGHDADVEGLERLLAEFRFDGKSEPQLPATNTIPVGRTSKRRFVLGLSFAASMAALVVVAFWITRAPLTSVATGGHNPESISETVDTRDDDRVVYPVADRRKDVVSMAEPSNLSRPKTNDVRSKLNRNVHAAKVEKAQLTKEEKFAYDRLMLALSITGSKLKVVQDTIDRKGDAGPKSILNEK
jgi:hypothetical protein